MDCLLGTGRARPIFDYFYDIILKFASAYMYKAACCLSVFSHINVSLVWRNRE